MARITCLKQLQDPGLHSLDSRDAVPWFCSSVSSIEDSLLLKIEGLICRLGSENWTVTFSRSDLICWRSEGKVIWTQVEEPSRVLGNRIAQDVTGCDQVIPKDQINGITELKECGLLRARRGQLRDGRWEY